MTPAGSPAFATAMGMVDRVHGDATHLRTFAEPTGTAGLAYGNILMVNIAHLTDSRQTILENHPHFTGGKLHLGVFPLFSHQLGKCSGTAGKLPAFAELKLDVVDYGAERDRPQRQRVTRLDIGIGTGNDSVTDLEIQWGKNIAFFPVNVVQK